MTCILGEREAIFSRGILVRGSEQCSVYGYWGDSGSSFSVSAGRRLAGGQLAQQGPLGHSRVSPGALAPELFIQLTLKAGAAQMQWRQVSQHHYSFSNRPVIMLLA